MDYIFFFNWHEGDGHNSVAATVFTLTAFYLLIINFFFK
jgi:hypothetical protein